MSYDSDSVETVVAITNNKQHPSSSNTSSSASMNEKLLEDTKQKMYAVLLVVRLGGK